MIFFTDRDLGAYTFPERLRAAGLQVERHIDHFAPGAPDEEWLPEVAARGWVILTQDEKMLRTPALRDAVLESGAALLILVGGSVPARVTAEIFINTLDQIERFLQKHKPPFISKVYRPSPGKASAEPRPGRIELKLWRS